VQVVSIRLYTNTVAPEYTFDPYKTQNRDKKRLGGLRGWGWQGGVSTAASDIWKDEEIEAEKLGKRGGRQGRG
jgi:hypothetical protein